MHLSKAATANVGMSGSMSPGLTLQEAQLVIEAWWREYNGERTHSSIGDFTLLEFIDNQQGRSHAVQDQLC